MRIQFRYNLVSDAKNWVRIIRSKHNSVNASWNDKIKGIPQNLLDGVLDVDERGGFEIVKDYLDKENKCREDIIKISIECLQKCWMKREEDYFKILEIILNKKLTVANYQVDITTMRFAPYHWSKNWFMVTLWNSLPKQLTAIAHEVFHIEFLRHYIDFIKKYNIEKNDMINIVESLTCLLNIEQFKNILLTQEQGYEKHKEMRDYIFKKYNQHQSLESVLQDVIGDYLVSTQQHF